MEFKLSKNRENYKKNSKNSKKIKNEAGAMYCLILLLMFEFSKKYFSELCPILKKSVGLW